MADHILEIKNLKKHFDVGNGKVLKAVDGINFAIKRGETFGLVGESGCGKSTAGRTIMRLYEATSGEVNFNGENIYQLKGDSLSSLIAACRWYSRTLMLP